MSPAGSALLVPAPAYNQLLGGAGHWARAISPLPAGSACACAVICLYGIGGGGVLKSVAFQSVSRKKRVLKLHAQDGKQRRARHTKK